MFRPRNQSSNAIFFGIAWALLLSGTSALLLFPSSTVLQLTSSMSVLMDLPKRKVFLDLGFQMNYNLPFSLSAFYNPATWANPYERRKRELANLTNSAMDLLEAESGIHPKDFTAGELYAGFERILEGYGFHNSCLERSVCELALHPMSDENGYNSHLIVQVINFLLTPSKHDGFGPNEKLYQERYERAEQLGSMGGDCEKAYPECEVDVINAITKIVR